MTLFGLIIIASVKASYAAIALNKFETTTISHGSFQELVVGSAQSLRILIAPPVWLGGKPALAKWRLACFASIQVSLRLVFLNLKVRSLNFPNCMRL